MRQIHRVSGTRIIDIETFLIRQQAVVAGVIDAAEREGRAKFGALGGMIIDDVQNHLQAGVVQAGHHFLEFGIRGTGIGGIARIGREETNRVIPPEVGQVFLQ